MKRDLRIFGTKKVKKPFTVRLKYRYIMSINFKEIISDLISKLSSCIDNWYWCIKHPQTLPQSVEIK